MSWIKTSEQMPPISENAKAYIDGGGIIFRVTEIDIIRDGGTVFIGTDEGLKFYGHKEVDTLHSAYPPDTANRVQDVRLLSYLKFRIFQYVERKSEDLERQRKAAMKINFDSEKPE